MTQVTRASASGTLERRSTSVQKSVPCVLGAGEVILLPSAPPEGLSLCFKSVFRLARLGFFVGSVPRHIDKEALDVENDGIRCHGYLAGRVLRFSGDDVELAEVKRTLHGAPVQIAVG